jgi:BASS family bile acid:Na+ symporter
MMDAVMALAEGWLLPVALWLVMFAMGLGLRVADFRHVVVNSRAFVLGVGSMMLLVPAIGVTLAVAFAPTPALMMGLILLATCPGGILSNLMTDLARGNVALSLSMSLFVSLVYIFTLPVIASVALDFVFGRSAAVPVPMLTSFANIVMVTLVPVLVGMVVRALLPRQALAIEPRVKSVATSVLVVVFALIVAQQWATLTAAFGIVLAVVVAMNLANLAIAFLVCHLGRLRRADRVAIAMEHIVRQEGTAIFVAVTLLHRSDMSLPMIVNTFIGMAIGIPAVAWLRRRAAAAPFSASIEVPAS